LLLATTFRTHKHRSLGNLFGEMPAQQKHRTNGLPPAAILTPRNQIDAVVTGGKHKGLADLRMIPTSGNE
jgi:hypothetical protein